MTEAGIEDTSHSHSDIDSGEGRDPDLSGNVVTRLLSAVGSPRLTTFLFVTAIGLILLGTLSQVYQDMWEVIEGYFRSWVVLVELKVLFPPSFFTWALHTDWDALAINRFPFPGGALIGSLLFINLLAAHITRFKVKARGARLVVGLVVLAAGAVTTWLVIDAGHNRHGVQGEPMLAWSTLWILIQIGLVALFLACVAAFVYVWRAKRPGRTIELGLFGGTAALLAPLLVWVFAVGNANLLTHSSLRILYQLIQGQVAATVLLIGCVFLFNRRAGIVLLHGGVGLLMFGEFFVSHFAAEEQMVLQEGQTVSFARDIRSVELVIFSRSKSGRKKVVAVPLVTTGKTTRFIQGDTIDLDGLPFDMEIVKYFENSTVRPVRPGEANAADKGMGLRYVAEKDTPRRGVGGGRVDLASAYVKFLDKKTGAELGTYLLSQHFASRIVPQGIAVGDQGYGLGIRFKRSNKPYQLTLLDVRKDDYVGTSMPRNYSSLVRLKDPKRNVEFETKIWMNNPLRYAGETFYQSGYNVDARGHETSTLQLVKNTGWMIPYVACMIAATGMLAHFFVVLMAFLQRVDLRNKEPDTDDAASLPRRSESGRQVKKLPTLAKWLVPGMTLLLSALWIGSKAVPPHRSSTELNLDAFGALPLMYEGRVKPFDTLARNSLRVLSNRETFKDTNGQRQPAIRWLLDVIARPRDAEKYRVFRVDSLELLEALGLERRQGFRYSWEEIRSGTMGIQKQLAAISQQAPEERTY